MKNSLMKYLTLTLGGFLLGALAASLAAPYLLEGWNPTVPPEVSVVNSVRWGVRWGVEHLLLAQLIAGAIGVCVGLLVGFAFRAKKKSATPSGEARLLG